MASEGAEKTEKPTERRRTEARRKGTVAKSQDLGGAAGFLAIVLVLPGVMAAAGKAFTFGFDRAVRTPGLEITQGDILRTAGAIAAPVAMPMLILAGTALGAGLVANVAQVGLHPSLEALIPKFSRIDPLQGFKRVIGKQGAFESAKALAKSVVFGFVAASVLRAHWAELLSLAGLPLPGAIGLIGNVVHTMLLRLGLTWFIIACVDYAFQRAQVEKSLMMSKDEVRREAKDAEASPEMKAQRIQMGRKLSKRRVAQAVREADVIVTNPTHYAVAIKYEMGGAHAPIVVAKGVDHLAAKIRELAAEHRVPIVPNPPLARALYRQCEVGDTVPRDLFGPVAEVLAYVYRVLRK